MPGGLQSKPRYTRALRATWISSQGNDAGSCTCLVRPMWAPEVHGGVGGRHLDAVTRSVDGHRPSRATLGLTTTRGVGIRRAAPSGTQVERYVHADTTGTVDISAHGDFPGHRALAAGSEVLEPWRSRLRGGEEVDVGLDNLLAVVLGVKTGDTLRVALSHWCARTASASQDAIKRDSLAMLDPDRLWERRR